MKVHLQSLFGLHVTLCAQLYSLAETPPLPPSSRIGTRIWGALLVSKDRRHLLVTPCSLSFLHDPPVPHGERPNLEKETF